MWILHFNFIGSIIGVGYQYKLLVPFALYSILLIVLCILLMVNRNRNQQLKQKTNMMQNLLDSQKSYYSLLLQKEEETKAFRHDVRNHIFCMKNLYQNKQYENLGRYLNTLNSDVVELSPKFQTGNNLVNIIINDISIKFPHVVLHWKGLMPAEINFSSMDICTIFYNLLSNAFEAAQKVADGMVIVEIKFMKSIMAITITNSSQHEPKIVNGKFISDKKELGHGYGLKNVKNCIINLNGSYSFKYKDGMFTTDITIPNAI